MIEEVQRFLRVNKTLLDKDMNEFFHIAYNGLTRYQMDELVDALDEAGIETLRARNNVLRFIITMQTEVLEKPIKLLTFANRYIKGALGFDTDYIANYILENAEEWDVKIYIHNNEYWIEPNTYSD